ncbi:hypothetical protein [Streptomyces caniscabiei]|uniref:hypothetical protein n=1 Tax=Streptomyces caniscabiei TaxID=2746961 RepID=UPI0007659E06|nr:hypothetical protein [Streptomyces caniscabiei]
MLAYPYVEGQTVSYHGSVAEAHGRVYRVWICCCRRAHPVEDPRLMLTDPDTGRAKAWHVRPGSLTPG